MRDTSEQSIEPVPRHPRASLKLAGIVALIAAIGVAANGIWQRHRSYEQLAAWTDAQSIPTVAVIHPQPESAVQPLQLPGDIHAWYEAPIYARVNGYLKMWYKDIGADVKAGELLAEIDTPDLDQQLIQAKQDLNTAVTNLKLAEVTARRWKALLSSASVSQQSVDEKVADAAAQQARVAAAQANVGRLEALEGFKRIVAPFDGVVTARRTDIGALINAGSGTGPELFAVADISRMRIYVRVPQAFSAQISVGMQATLSLPQYPDRTFPAKVLTTANAINPESRTLLVELVAENPDRALWPGTYATVTFEVPANNKVVQIPASALLFRAEGLQVAVVEADNRITLRSVKVGRNFGTMIEVLSGLNTADLVVDNPPDAILSGQKVQPQEQNAAVPSHRTGQGNRPTETH